jgi:hypothetical protein
MPTTETLKKYRIFSREDLQEVDVNEYSSVEIYAKNTGFDCTEINGNLILRGEGCRFPELKTIRGNLSVDAGHCVLNHLKTVEGNFSMHRAAELDRLEKVKGNIKCIVDFSFKNLMTVGGSLDLKNAMVYARGKKLVKGRIIIPIHHQYQVDHLPKDGIFNADVFGDGIVFPHREIYGKINVFGKNISFPVLELIHGTFKIEGRKRSETPSEIGFPELKKIAGTLIIENTEVLIENTRFPKLESIHGLLRLERKSRSETAFPELKRITGALNIGNTKVDFPKLLEIKGHVQLLNNSHACFPVLESSGNVMIKRGSAADLPELKVVNGLLENNGSETCELIKLEKVTGYLNTANIVAKNLIEAGTLVMYKYSEFDHLKRINQGIHFTGSVNFKSLEYINYFTDEQQKGSEFPSLKEINHYLYDGNGHFEDLANHIYFKVTDRIYLTKDKFIIARGRLPNINRPDLPALKKLVSVLKLRHRSFQNFITREYEREWTNYDTPHFLKILNKIEKLWDDTEMIKFEEFFNSNDLEFRIFCFSYLGVGTLMTKLGAKKINQEEIRVHYFKYDKNGNESAAKRTNHYEVYQVENEKLGIPVWGRVEKHSYAVKCWCPSTNGEHWLWIEPQYKNSALAAIASTFRIHENVIPHIKALKRQGDLLLCELKKEVIPKGEVRPLTAKEYFGLLEAET